MQEQHIPAPVPKNDADRVEFLRSLQVLDTEHEEGFDRITDAAHKCFDVPIALVSLVDAERQWFKSCIGLDVDSTHRDLAFCAHAILPKKPVTLVVENALEDERFKNSPLVLGPPNIRFYAGAPLCYTSEEGEVWKLGTLCIIDDKPRKMTEDQVALLEMLARLVVTELELRAKFRKRTTAIEQKADKHAVVRATQLNTAYIGQVAHDLRTPLNSFSLGLEALRAMDASPEMLQVIDTMWISAELMDITCTKAVDHSKMEVGRDLSAQHSPFHLLDVIKKSQIVVNGYTHESRSVKYEYMVEEGVAQQVISDKEWFWHMIMNYLSNARKFTNEGSIRTSIGVKVEGGMEFLDVRVADTGIGIEEEHRKKLFSAFSQLQDFAGGTGLGLYSVLQKVNVLGGACGVEGNTPKGSVFWFRIPYTPVPSIDRSVAAANPQAGMWVNSSELTFETAKEEERQNSPQNQASGTPKSAKGKILLIEDDRPTRTLMARGLEKKGYEVVQAVNGVEGLEKMQEGLYNMVLCDIMMPVLDGIECCRRLRQWEQTDGRPGGVNQYICALSANTEQPDVQKTRDVGMNDFFPKPVKIKELLKHLDGKFLVLP
mmetsp:Transcript_39279/g.76852  ORF Transcript_39279/g.76852 Transcript_39279/m.76852 type:complete len:600 (+) Transcript_39279:184-1983(+)|eukprot:CAMPEP_0173383188 /NCGR_PEP_ID=MMETSP1356-20130122/5720_1 /TAXON_ID=77927 ORGANISM="Hemiselmis virescens, Strain PCC157" /NCGR_SAMPLE_ID=MMETSP1356 /ASSEMBLY_ACC=CAM_ASM_000847 /LENGTH=599 /DNA_ID=CAMNT_0014337919 /DNA_START=78 /DNA_END=1877 /DNA_ORIENTATION=+